MDKKPDRREIKIIDLIKKFRAILAEFMILIFLFFIIYIGYQEIKTEYVLIEPFDVPKKLEELGFTGRVMANKMIDQIHYIRARAKTKMKSQVFTPIWSQSEAKIEIPGSSLSLNAALQLFRRFLGREPFFIKGEIILNKNLLVMTIRAANHPPSTFSGELAKIDTHLIKAAEYAYKFTQPYILAAYLSDRDKRASIEMIKYILSAEPSHDDPWAYNLWGNILSEDQGSYEEAIAKYKRAIELDGKFAAPHNGLGVVLSNQQKYGQAAEMFQGAIRLAPDYAEAHNNLGYVMLSLKKYEDAIVHFQKSTELDPKYSTAYVNWGIALGNQGDKKKAIEKFSKAIELDPDGEVGKIARVYLGKWKEMQ